MAAKRHGNFQLKVPSAAYKKARLDIEVVSSQHYHQHRQVQQVPAVRTPTTVAQSSDSLWGEEDDEFIMLASQAVEEVEMFQNSQTGDVTFGRFARQTVPSSTQQQMVGSDELMPPPLAPAGAGPSKKVLPEVIDLLTDGDDDVFTENYDDIEKHIDNFFKDEVDDDFKLDDIRQEDAGEPVPVVEMKEKLPEPGPSRARFAPTQRQTQVDREAQLNAAKKKEHAQEIQIKFLTKQLEMASKKTEQIQKECNEALERLQTKEGEAVLLRYQLDNAKSTNDQLRLDKMKESETMAKEWATKIKDLSNVIVAQQSELEFKSLEMMNIRTKRTSNSFRGADKSIIQEPPVTSEDFRAHHRRLALFQHHSTPSYEIDPKIFDRSVERISKFNTNSRISTFTKSDAVVSQCLGSIQTHLSQLAAQRSPLPQESIDSITQTAHRAFTELLKYSNQLKLVRVKYKHLGPKVAFEFLCKNAKTSSRLQGDVNICERDPIFAGEQAILTRRFLTALAILCKYLPALAVSLVRSQVGGGHCVGLLGKALNKLGYAVELYEHTGMVTAAAALLSSLSCHVGAMEER